MSAGVDGDLLIVCAANVCRSPFAAFLLAKGLPEAIVSSVGVSARTGDPLCGFTREQILTFPEGEDFVESHSATRLDAAAIDEADLILTASEAERSAVAVLVPSARTKTFTLVEAAHSARSLAQPLHDMSLLTLAASMHAQRGMVDLPQVRRRARFALRKPSYGIAIPDAHIGDTRRHDEVYRTVSEAVGMFLAALDRSNAVVGGHS